MRFRLLGPVEVQGPNGVVPLGGPKTKAVLVSLLLRHGQVVPSELLVESVWGDERPPSALSTLHSYVSRLRRALAGASAGEDRITTVADGYRIVVSPAELDVEEFHALRERAQRAVDADDLKTARAVLRQALALRAGPILSGVPGVFADTKATLLEDLWQSTHEECLGIDLRLGLHQDILPELRVAWREQPMREPLAGKLMLALHRCGQSAEALAVFRHTRDALVDELGIEPGMSLRTLHEQILNDDPALHSRHDQASRPHRGLPRSVADFTGRAAELARLTADDGGQGPVIWTIDGMAGVGKTALALRAAHLLAGRHPDLQLLVDLRGHTPGRRPHEPEQALEIMLGALGVRPSSMPATEEERASLWRSMTADRRALVVFDDAASAAQVRPLLPAGRDCVVLVTSRGRLSELDGTRTLSLEPLPARDAETLFGNIVGADRAEREPAAVAEAVEICGHLPLAIRVAAGRLRSRPAWSVAQLAQRLRDETSRLAELTGPEFGVTSALQLCYSHLGEEERRFFRMLGLHLDSEFDAFYAAAASGVDPGRAEALLESLVDVHMLQQPSFGRYQLHALLRLYAMDRLRAEEPALGRRAAVQRVLHYLTHTQHNLYRTLFPSARPLPLGPPPSGVTPRTFGTPEEALRWREMERLGLLNSRVGIPLTDLSRPGRRIPWSRLGPSFRRLHVIGRMLAAPLAWPCPGRHTAMLTEGAILGDIGVLCAWQRQYDQARQYHLRALELFRAADGPVNEAATLCALGALSLYLGQPAAALNHYRQARKVYLRLGESWGRGLTHTGMALALDRLGRPTEALHWAEAAVDVLGGTDGHRELAVAAELADRTRTCLTLAG
ncbi:AfsR/SARP family transcriptional regulator [Amycolatopsis suaedae]|uniref:AfsR/SARP family transcriptional regulator n=1 Tax=Amycolatopsis suaedae TaxID=2510978 RepID=UPI0013EEFF75|nr:AfsR/SARP family transcriptional regulator [Amycolatopsis suaedae]